MNTTEYLDAAAKATKSLTDYQLAKRLGLSNARISDYRKGHRRPDEYACTRIAVALGVDPAIVIAEIAVEWEKNEERRRWWSDFLRYFGKASAIGGMLVLIYIVSSPVAQAAGSAARGDTITSHYANFLRRLFAMFHRCSTKWREDLVRPF